MRKRLFPLSRYSVCFSIVAAVVVQAAAVRAQSLTFVKPSISATAMPAMAPADNSPSSNTPDAVKTAAISHVLESGRTLEQSGHWADALTKYDEALHEYPEDQQLQARFDLARLHYSLEQRYDDRSFREALHTMRPQQSLDLYNDLLSKIDEHYYTTPPWQSLVQRGTEAVNIALADENFLRTQGIRVRGQQIDQLRAEIEQLPEHYRITSARDAAAVASQVARLASQRIGLSETATLLEFTSAAGGGLDHYSSFLTADQLHDIYSQIEGNFVGLGVELKADHGALQIVHVIPHSPAEQSGIHDGDLITAVDGKATKSLSTDEAASLLTGPEGSTVRVTVSSPGQASHDISVRRANVDVPSLENVKILDPATGVAYVKIPAFQKTTAADLEQALWDLHRQGMRSLIIDLRGNPGGLLTAAVEIADKFIAEGGIVSTKGRSEQENFSYRAHRPGTWRVPLVVMIDGDSASASEIFAGAIKDSGRGKIVGMRSYGKGSVQGIFPLGKSGCGARITTAKFFSPSGRAIANAGVTPDIDVRNTTLAATGQTSTTDSYLVGFRGANGISAPMANGAATGGTTTSAPKSAQQDRALEIAVGVVRQLPVAQL
ncbi:MAG TPA: S41 family peptidase [Lacipirellulaceae bacterium]|nr:S41 family peptidase [Lacipirellulaceae bacterium]